MLAAGETPRAWDRAAGHLELACALDSRGESYFARQSFRPPFHLSKPHRDGRTLIANIASTSPGLLAGDSLAVNVAVEAGADLLLTTPGATRVHRVPHGSAELHQTFAVAAGGRLEVWPELFIPHRGARFRQRTVFHVERGAEALLFECIAPGRVASGEAFAFHELSWATDIFVDRRLIARERYRLRAGCATVLAMQQAFPCPYYASCYAVGAAYTAPALLSAVLALHGSEVWVGCSRLAEAAMVIKVVASGSVALRRTVGAIRERLHAAAGRSLPSLRRVQPIG